MARRGTARRGGTRGAVRGATFPHFGAETTMMQSFENNSADGRTRSPTDDVAKTLSKRGGGEHSAEDDFTSPLSATTSSRTSRSSKRHLAAAASSMAVATTPATSRPVEPLNSAERQDTAEPTTRRKKAAERTLTTIADVAATAAGAKTPPTSLQRLRARKKPTSVEQDEEAETSVSRTTPSESMCYPQQMATAPAKCLLSEDGFRRLGGLRVDRYVERRSDGSYHVHEDQRLFDEQISSVSTVCELSDDQIRYLFYRIEFELRNLAADGRSSRHRLFMADRADVLNFAMPFKEYTDHQRKLIRNLCQDHLRIKCGFNDFYVMQVLIPEACIRIHMAVHGTTFEESDVALDPGLVDLNEALQELDDPDNRRKHVSLTSILCDAESASQEAA